MAYIQDKMILNARPLQLFPGTAGLGRELLFTLYPPITAVYVRALSICSILSSKGHLQTFIMTGILLLNTHTHRALVQLRVIIPVGLPEPKRGPFIPSNEASFWKNNHQMKREPQNLLTKPNEIILIN